MDDHGNTPAAWTGVGIAIGAFVVGAIGVTSNNWPVFWVGIALLPVAALVGKALAKAGYGQQR